MRVLAVDYGRKRIGLAMSDPGRTMGFARPPLQVRSKKQAAADIAALALGEDVADIVVGLPLTENGQETPMSLEAQAFGRSLAGRTGLPVHHVNEHLSSSEAESQLREAGITTKGLQARLDSQAAVVILESFLAGCQRPSTAQMPVHGSEDSAPSRPCAPDEL